MSVEQNALDLLVQASRVDPKLRAAVFEVEKWIARLKDSRQEAWQLRDEVEDALREARDEIARLRGALAWKVRPMSDAERDHAGALVRVLIEARRLSEASGEINTTRSLNQAFARLDAADAAIQAEKRAIKAAASTECGATSWLPEGHAICRGPGGHDDGHVWEVQ